MKRILPRSDVRVVCGVCVFMAVLLCCVCAPILFGRDCDAIFQDAASLESGSFLVAANAPAE